MCMAKPHWQVLGDVPGWGCQHSACEDKATLQWQRVATDAEVAAEAAVEGPYGAVYRNVDGPHHVAVFGCGTHAVSLDAAAIRHAADCPAPDDGCVCA